MSRSPTTNEGRRSRSPIECSDRDRSKKTKATGGFRWKKGDKTAEKAESQERAEPTIRPRRVEDRTGLEERDDLSSKFGANYKTAYARPAAETKVISGTEVEGVVEKKKKPKKDKGPRPTAEPMIRVFVNDRLGTRAEIPCLASDPISKYFQDKPEVFITGYRVYQDRYPLPTFHRCVCFFIHGYAVLQVARTSSRCMNL